MYGGAYYVCTTPGLSGSLAGSFGKHKNPLILPRLPKLSIGYKLYILPISAV